MNQPALLDLIVSRRSADKLGEPGPTRAELEQMLLATATVPDHGTLRPFRFVVAEGEGRGRFGDALAASARERRPDLPTVGLEKVRSKAFRSPTLVALIFSPKVGKIDLWEQKATAACAGYALVLAAHALGVGAVWKSVPFTTGAALAETLGFADGEEMLGWIHLGRALPEHAPDPRDPVALADLATVLDASGRSPM